MILKNIYNFHLIGLNLNEPVCVLMREGFVITDNVTIVGDGPHAISIN